MNINTDTNKISELLSRGVENIYPNREFLEKRLKSGEQLTLYTGYDPTAPTLHIGHGITMLKLRQFQELGHKIIMLIGDFTGTIGDPTDKTSARQQLTKKQVLENCKSYKKQAASILNFSGSNSVEVKYNSKWLAKMTFADVIELASHFTVQRLLERDMFEKRMYGEIECPNGHWFCAKNIVEFDNNKEDHFFLSGEQVVCPKCLKNNILNARFDPRIAKIKSPVPIHVHEFMYPLMQGYDSLAMDVDGEIGGNDQTFNMLAGRDLIKVLKNKEKFVLTTRLLVDSSGKKMGKSEGNMVSLADTPEDMFGKVMSWTDEMIARGFELCTRLPAEEIKKITQEIANPRDQKVKLAFEVVKTFLGEKEAQKAQEYFISTFSKKETPDEMPEIKPSAYDIVTTLVESKVCASKSEARRAIEQKGVKINDKKAESIEEMTMPGDIVQKGSRFFIKVK